ncbi:MAG: hypothetical protein NVSMB43_22580 [Pseudarthrobacter sp.]
MLYHNVPVASRDNMTADRSPLQGQAHEIIVSILDDPSPGLDGVKERLSRCLAAHPHAPELALLEHLRETVKIVNAEPGQ